MALIENYTAIMVIFTALFIYQAVFEGKIQASYINKGTGPVHKLWAMMRVPLLAIMSLLLFYYIDLQKDGIETTKYFLYLLAIPCFWGVLYMLVFDESLNYHRWPPKPLGYLGGEDDVEDSVQEQYFNFFKKKPWINFVIKLSLVTILIIILFGL